MTTEVALKVDVDTHEGARDGIPRLVDMLADLGIVASFFVAMGPDHSGRAILRLLTRTGFLGKMLRTRAPSAYGWRTIFSGTLLPARPVGAAFPETLRSLEREGHEVGPHGWDHVRWHDRLSGMDAAETRREIEKAFAAFERVTGHAPRGSAAPGWQCTAHSLAAQDDLGLVYHSDVRGRFPFVPRAGGRVFRAIELPTTFPTLDEVLGTAGVERDGLVGFFDARLLEGRLNVLTVHAEMEGARHTGFLRDLLLRWRDRGVVFPKLIDVAERILSSAGPAPPGDVVWGELPGRPGRVACQAPPA